MSEAMQARTVDTTDPAELTAIYDEDVELVTLARKPSPEVEAFADALLARRLRLEETLEVDCSSAVDELTRRIAPTCAELPGVAAWLDDVGELVEVFAELFGVQRVGLRAVTLSGPMCPRFHVDRIPVRLLTTYTGPGTEWLRDQEVERKHLGPGAEGRPDEQSGLLKPGARIQQASVGALGLFKGSAWEGGSLYGIVHRSPHAARGRLLVSLDPLGYS